MNDDILDKKVLIVDDDITLLELMKEFFSFKFSKVFIAENGKIALEEFKKINPDLVITDLVMPVLNGAEMAKEIKKISPKTPVIAITAFKDDEFDKSGIDFSFSKPVNRNKLFEVINKLLRSLN